MSSHSSLHRSWFRRLADALGSDHRRSLRRSRNGRRVFGPESLEGRSMLSATILPSISGVAYHDLTGNGLSADDVRLPGITISLWKDGGDGQFGGAAAGSDDQFVGTAKTTTNGSYTFPNLSAGTYFVQEGPVTGLVIPASKDVQTVTIAAGDTLGTTKTVIDSFGTTEQYVSAARHASLTGSSAQMAPEALGGYRDMFVQLTSPSGGVSLGANADVPGTLDFAANSASNGIYWITWDGQGNSAQTLNATGLGQIDLTSAGAGTGIEMTLGADHDGSSVMLKVYSDANDWSWADVTIPNTTDGTANQSVYVPWSSFAPGSGSGSGADFTKVGAVQLDVNNAVNAADGQVGPITVVGPKVFNENFANTSQAALVLTKTGAPDPVKAGSQLTYTLTTTNDGPSDATGVWISDTLPAGVQYVSAGGVGGTTAIAYSGTVTLQLGNLAAGASDTTTIVVTVAATTTGTLTNTATVTGNEPDPNLTNNTAKCTTTISQPGIIQDTPNLSITKVASPSPVSIGATLTYTLMVTNNSVGNATGVVLTDPLPAGLTYDFATTSVNGVTASFNSASDTVTVPLGVMAPGATDSVTIVVTVGSNVGTSIVNTATVTEGNSQWSATATTPVGTAPTKRWLIV